MGEPADRTAYEYALEASTVEGIRFYVERLAFTRRGNFAFVVAMLYLIHDGVSYAVTTGTPTTDVPIYVARSGFLENTLAALSGLVTVLTGLIGAFLVLFLLDAYEAKVGLSIDPDH